jgi:galactitol-specific phosphotransferase system IIC component
MTDRFVLCFLLGVPVGSIALTVTRARVFMELRLYIAAKFGPLAEELTTCPFCFSWWVSFAFSASVILNSTTESLTNSYFLELFACSGVMVATAMVVCRVMTEAIMGLPASRDKEEE